MSMSFVSGGRMAGKMRVAMEERARLADMACEKAIQTGTSGVAQVADGLSMRWFVTDAVPYGNIYEFPTPESYRIFLDSQTSDPESR